MVRSAMNPPCLECHALSAAIHMAAPSASTIRVILLASRSSSLPASVLGLPVRSLLVLRSTCTRQRWTRTPSHRVRAAAMQPAPPSAASASGRARRPNSPRYAAAFSLSHHRRANGLPSSPVATSRHQP